MSYKLKYIGKQIDDILDRAVEGGVIDDALALKAPLESPALTGAPTAPTPAEGDDSTKVATTAYADRAAKSAAEEVAAATYITDTASGSIASFSDGADGVAMRSLKVAIAPVQSGSGDPSPDNVRPISGWTGAEVNVTAVNIYDQQWELGSISATTGELTASSTNIRSKDKIPVHPSASYRFLFVDGATNVVAVHAYDAGDNWLGMYDPDTNAWKTTGGGIGYITVCPVFTTPADAAYIRFRIGGKTTYTEGQISINTPSTVTDYMPFGTTFPVTWESQAGEVYGGYFVVNSDGSVDLTATHKTYAITETTQLDFTASAQYGARGKLNVAGMAMVASEKAIYAISEVAEGVSYENRVANVESWRVYGELGNAQLNLRASASDNIQTVEALRAPFVGTKILYRLAMPITYRLASVTGIKTLLGQNNVWADCGDTEVEYVADPKLYIDKMLGGGALALGSVSPLSVKKPVTISKEDLEQSGEVSEVVKAAAEAVIPAETGEQTEEA